MTEVGNDGIRKKIGTMISIFVVSNLCMIGIVALTYLIPNMAL